MTPRFRHFAVADWSGAKGERQKGIAIAICSVGAEAPLLVRPDRVWSREDVLAWLTEDLPDDTLVGLDLAPGLPFADAGGFFPGWSESPAEARDLWALVERISADDPHLAVSTFVDHPEASRYLRRHGGRRGDRFGEQGGGRLREVEFRQRGHGLSPYSCLNLVGAAQVGKSSLTAMRLLHRLAGRLPVWPFDPVPEHGSLIVEIYTSLAARAAGIGKGRSKIRDGAALDAALAALASSPHAPLTHYSDHATDAILTTAWLRANACRPELWTPAGLEAVRRTEGWTFGVL
ncbi:hypothetical protein [Sphingosinicella sp.]|uniref:hypothetical protein n=1 Tax=Sphingosinicella sp. TaxID=1917971 RepID=UPI0040380461